MPLYGVPRNLHRRFDTGHLHVITSSCFRRRAFLGTPRRRDLFLQILEQASRRYDLVVVGYVVMRSTFTFSSANPSVFPHWTRTKL